LHSIRKCLNGEKNRKLKKFYEIQSIIKTLFNADIELLPSVDEMFELELAFLEYNVLDNKEFLERTAFTKSLNCNLSNHFLCYSELSSTILESRSTITQPYFKEGQFSTGYATHGLFPYRGKFHPQLIKGLINILGIEKGQTILDPMAGSGTTNIEASMLGIDSLAIDVSPFCQFMIQTKYDALTIDLELLNKTHLDAKKMFSFYSQRNVLERIAKVGNPEKIKIYNLAFLAYLDALGYSRRVKTSNHEQLFNKVLLRYLETVSSFLNNPYFNKKNIGTLEILKNSEALNIFLKDESVDCVITSPPYSFAIDYVDNDKDQLEFLGYDTKELKNKFIGLKGKTKNQKLENYFSDMDTFCFEVSRVVKTNSFFVLIIGSNTNQTGGIRLEETVINSAKKYNMYLIKSILKKIKGMRNTMKDEYVLIFKKG